MPDEGRGAGRPRAGHDRPSERGVGGLVGSGPSIVGVSGAMRARDVSPVSAELLEQASKRVVVRRRTADVPPAPHGPVPHPPPPHDRDPVDPGT